jgi:hypothetical protein
VVRRILLALALTAPTAEARAASVDVAAWAAALPAAFTVHGTKTEPTWQESVDIRRDGDRIVVTGGAPGWADRAMEVARVSREGTVCLAEVGCPAGVAPSGFLATAGLLAAARRHGLRGRAAVVPFGARQVLCLPGESLGIAAPILDPCFDRESGAAVAQRHRTSGAFDGPTLDPASLTIVIGAAASPSSEHRP